jgi:hypothetical protein
MSQPERPDYRAGLPDHHDPLAGIGGAPPARSALTLRLVLASIGLVAFLTLTVVFAVLGIVLLAALCGLVALSAVVDLTVIVRRKARGEPG